MSGREPTGPRDRAAILAERLEVVLAIGEANAARQRAQALVGGTEIEMMRVGGGEEGGAVTPEQAEARAADAAAREALAAAEARIDTLDARLAALDADLADADR